MFSRSGGERTAAVVAYLIGPSLFVALLTVSVWALGLWDASADRQHRAEQEAAHQFERAENAVEEKCVGTASFVTCESEVIDASRDYHRNEYDLAAQQDMAQYALLGVFVALLGLIVTSVATFLVYQTLRATLDAVNEARGATDAANRAVDVTEQMGRAQARAYVDAMTAHIHYNNGDYSVRVTLRNGGQTPAKGITFYGATEVIDVRLPVEPPDFATLIDGARWGPLRAAGESTVPILCEETECHYNAVVEAHGHLTIRAFGRVRYTTVFGETYETEFCFHTNKASNLIKSGTNGGFAEDPVVMWHAPLRLRTYQLLDEVSES